MEPQEMDSVADPNKSMCIYILTRLHERLNGREHESYQFDLPKPHEIIVCFDLDFKQSCCRGNKLLYI